MENAHTKKEYKFPTTHDALIKRNDGRIIAIRCPSGKHSDSTPSFTLYPDGGFYCFGCGVSGQHGLDFLVKVLGFSFKESMDYLESKGLA